MEDKRTALAIFLSIIVVMIYHHLVVVPEQRARQAAFEQAQLEKLNESKQGQSSSAAIAPPPVVSEQRTSPTEAAQASAPAPRFPTSDEIASNPIVKVRAKLFEIELAQLGARLKSFKLNRYWREIDRAERYDKVSSSDAAPLPLGVYAGKSNDNLIQYRLVSSSMPEQQGAFVVPKGGELTLVFEGELGDGRGISKVFRFIDDSYLFDVEVKLNEPNPDAARTWLEWGHFIPGTEIHQRLNPKEYTVLTADDELDHIQVLSLPETASEFTEYPRQNRWIGIGDKYFLSALIPNSSGVNSQITWISLEERDEFGDIAKEDFVYFVRAAGGDKGGKFTVFLGPKDIEIMKRSGYDLERSIDLGFFAFLASPLLSLIRIFHGFLHNYGLAIILLTLLIKTIFLPLTKASFESTRAMQELQPEMKALRERIKDPNQLNQEMLALYKKRGVNPMGGCLPILVQLPVFFGLYSALYKSLDLRHAPFGLWIHDLSAPERLEVLGIGIPLMIILWGASMYLQQLTTPAPMDPTQQKMMRIMPVIFTGMFLFIPIPSGLALYMLVNTVITIIQQAYLRRDENATPLRATAVASVIIFAVGYVLTLL